MFVYGKKVKQFIVLCMFLSEMCAYASPSMFDDDGNYSVNWKQMTNVSSYSNASKYNSSAYSSSAWYANNDRQKIQHSRAVYTNQNVHKTDVMPFRYNTLDYTRIRKVKGGYGDYSSRCSDIGDASFCH